MSVILISNTAGRVPTVNQLLNCESNLGYNRADGLFYGLKVVGGVKSVICLGESIAPGTDHVRLHAMDSVLDHAAVAVGDRGKIPQADPITGEWKLIDMPEGVSTQLTLSIFKQGANGIVFPQRFKWTASKTVSSVQLLSNCTAISVTIGATTYNQSTLVGVTLAAGTELVINDITIQTGFDNANVIIIF